MIKILIPPFVKEYCKLVKNRFKFKNSSIDTPYIMSNVKIGDKCSINRDVIIMSNTSIDKYSYVNFGTKIGFAHIGKFCSIGNNCEIGMHSHPTNYISTSPKIYGTKNILNLNCKYNEFNKPVVIENDVWIGSGAIIMQGVKIGNGAIVGAGSVVTKNVEPYEIVIGSPAKHLKYRFNENTISYLQDLKWWNMELNKIDKIKAFVELGIEWENQI